MASNGDIVDLDQLRAEAEEQGKEHYDWTFANGRRYASSQLGHYYMPNDEPEIQRLNQQHWVFTEAKGGAICNAPLPKDKAVEILDIGCGTGIWCLSMAEDFPQAKITGADVSPIQPNNKPANVGWVVLDMEKDWPFELNTFDLIHLSLVHGCVTDWPGMLTKILTYLKPGGFIEHQEFNFAQVYTLEKDGRRLNLSDLDETALGKWSVLMCEAQEKRGRAMQLGPNLKAWQAAAGFKDVHESIYGIPIGTWPEDPKMKALGAQYAINVLGGIEGFTMTLFTKVLGWTTENTQEYIERCRQDLSNNKLRKMIDLHVVYGQKPA